jgi:cobalt-zinc-cadmium efflux system outer membrane protein
VKKRDVRQSLPRDVRQSFPRALFIAAVAALASGCSVPREAGFPDVAKAIQERTSLKIHWKTGTEEDRKVEGFVAELLDKELTEDSAVQIALLNNPALQAIFEDLGVAQADVVQAGLLENPQFTGSILFPLRTGLRKVDLGITQGFLSALLIPAKKRVAEAAFERVKLEVSQAVVDLATKTRIAYYHLVASRQMLAIGRAVLEGAEASAELARRQAEAGNVGEIASATERAAYERILIDVARREGRAGEAREDLVVLLGLFGKRASEVRTREMLAELPPADPGLDHLEQRAVTTRFDLLAARREAEGAARSIDLAKAGRYTGVLDVGADAAREDDGRWFLGPSASLTLPIFDQGQAMLFALEARKRKADQRLFALAIEVRSEVRRSQGRMVLARQVAERYKTSVIPLAERVVLLSQQAYDAMLAGVYQLIATKREEAEAYSGYVEAIRDYWVARAELARAVGGKLPD